MIIHRGFPRWAYSFLGWALLFAWWWSSMGFYGHTMDWKIWLPLLGVFLVTLLARRSFQPLSTLFTGIWRDWTLLSLGLYIFYGWFIMLSDENHDPNIFIVIAAASLAFSLGAWGYFRSGSPLRRVLALVGGLFLAIIVGVISGAFWDTGAYNGLPESSPNISLIGLIFIAILILFI